MKTCEKCGKEIVNEAIGCENCKQAVVQGVNYESMISKSKTTNLISLGVLAVAVVCLLFINGWLGAALCLVSEVIALSPRNNVLKAFNKENKGKTDKKKVKDDRKTLTNDLKAKNKDYKLSFVIGIVAFVCLVLCFVIPSPITALFADDSALADTPTVNTTEPVTQQDIVSLTAEELVEKLDTTFQNTVELKFEFSIEKLSGERAFIHVKSQGNEIMNITYMPTGSVLGIVNTVVDLKALGKEVTGSIDELQYVATCVAAIPTLVVMENQGGTEYTANDWNKVTTDLVSSLKVENALTYSSVKAFDNWELTLKVTDYQVTLSADTKD